MYYVIVLRNQFYSIYIYIYNKEVIETNRELDFK